MDSMDSWPFWGCLRALEEQIRRYSPGIQALHSFALRLRQKRDGVRPLRRAGMASIWSLGSSSPNIYLGYCPPSVAVG